MITMHMMRFTLSVQSGRLDGLLAEILGPNWKDRYDYDEAVMVAIKTIQDMKAGSYLY